MNDIQAAVASLEGERAFVREIHALVRADRFAEAEGRLLGFLAGHEDPVARAARALTLDRLSIDWEEVNRFLSRTRASGEAVTALGLDFSNYADSGNGEPTAEVALYSDGPHRSMRFSTSSRADLLAATEDCRLPWQGEFDHVIGIELAGFAPLNRMLVDQRRGQIHEQRASGSPAYAVHVCGWLLTGLRFHQLIADRLRMAGLSRRLPVLVGGHGEPHVAQSAYFHEQVTAPKPRPRPDPKEKAERLAEQVKGGMRRHFPKASGPLADIGITFLAHFLVNSSEQRKQRRRRERGMPD